MNRTLTLMIIAAIAGITFGLAREIGERQFEARQLAGLYSDAWPPARYQAARDWTVVRLATVPPVASTAVCVKLGSRPPPAGSYYPSCKHTFHGDQVVVAPNPCAFRGERFAQLMCHELAHVHGWPADHPR